MGIDPLSGSILPAALKPGTPELDFKACPLSGSLCPTFSGLKKARCFHCSPVMVFFLSGEEPIPLFFAVHYT